MLHRPKAILHCREPYPLLYITAENMLCTAHNFNTPALHLSAITYFHYTCSALSVHKITTLALHCLYARSPHLLCTYLPFHLCTPENLPRVASQQKNCTRTTNRNGYSITIWKLETVNSTLQTACWTLQTAYHMAHCKLHNACCMMQTAHSILHTANWTKQIMRTNPNIV